MLTSAGSCAGARSLPWRRCGWRGDSSKHFGRGRSEGEFLAVGVERTHASITERRQRKMVGTRLVARSSRTGLCRQGAMGVGLGQREWWCSATRDTLWCRNQGHFKVCAALALDASPRGSRKEIGGGAVSVLRSRSIIPERRNSVIRTSCATAAMVDDRVAQGSGRTCGGRSREALQRS